MVELGGFRGRLERCRQGKQQEKGQQAAAYDGWAAGLGSTGRRGEGREVQHGRPVRRSPLRRGPWCRCGLQCPCRRGRCPPPPRASHRQGPAGTGREGRPRGHAIAQRETAGQLAVAAATARAAAAARNAPTRNSQSPPDTSRPPTPRPGHASSCASPPHRRQPQPPPPNPGPSIRRSLPSSPPGPPSAPPSPWCAAHAHRQPHTPPRLQHAHVSSGMAFSLGGAGAGAAGGHAYAASCCWCRVRVWEGGLGTTRAYAQLNRAL